MLFCRAGHSLRDAIGLLGERLSDANPWGLTTIQHRKPKRMSEEIKCESPPDSPGGLPPVPLFGLLWVNKRTGTPNSEY